MDTEKINSVSLILIIAIVFFIEIGVAHLALSPLMTTGTARCLEIVLILLVLYWFHNGAECIGLSRDQILPGFKKGIIWSAGFGLLATIVGGGLYFSGVNPFRLLHVGLPKAPADIALFYLVGGLIAPVAEEIFFRGVIYGYTKRLLGSTLNQWSIPAAIIISTYLFVTAHQIDAGFPLPQLAGGIVFCISYEVEKSLMTPIVIHSLGNIALFSISII